jgi:hypothetical protein
VGENSRTGRPFHSRSEKQLSGIKDGDNRHDCAPQQQHDNENEQRRSEVFQARLPGVATPNKNGDSRMGIPWSIHFGDFDEGTNAPGYGSVARREFRVISKGLNQP